MESREESVQRSVQRCEGCCLKRNFFLFSGGADEADEGGAAEEEDGGGKAEP